MSKQQNWKTICHKNDLVANSGVCALVNDNEQVAIFHIPNKEQVFAVSNYDPLGKANVLYRGIIGSIADEPVVASPLYKQHFSLLTGHCLQEDDIQVKVYPARLEDDQVQLLA